MSNKNLFEFIDETLEVKKEKKELDSVNQVISNDFFKDALSESPKIEVEIKEKLEILDVEKENNLQSKESENTPIFSKSVNNSNDISTIPEIAVILAKQEDKKIINKDENLEKKILVDKVEEKEDIPEIAKMISHSGEEVIVTKSVGLEDLKRNESYPKKYKRPTLSDIMNIKIAIPEKNYNIKIANAAVILVALIFLSISF